MISLFKALLTLFGLVLIFYFLLKATANKDGQQLKKAFLILVILAGLLILITGLEMAIK
jgi:hypothetical protein